ncbi:MAG TPA: LiaF domain-containing protein, partial [Gaiellaceae bacterium]|nr:LiaF domain-containing protein [Gaiellaceae bacterium]
GEAREAPRSPAEVEPYRHGVGRLTVDLTGLELEEEGPVAVEASVGVGELVVLVPRLADVSVDARVGLGNADVLGETEAGVAVDLEEPVPPAGAPDLELQLEVGLGSLRVQRADGRP